MDINEITSKIIKAAMTVHNQLGPGLLESVYKECLRIELEEIGLHVQREVSLINLLSPRKRLECHQNDALSHSDD